MTTKYQATKGTPGKRYVRAAYGCYAWIVQNAADPKYDFQQGTCDAEDLPPEVKTAADALRGSFPPYVEWPT